MPTKKAAIKYLRKSRKLAVANALVKRNIKNIIKRRDKALADGSLGNQAKELTHAFQKAIDKAVKSGVLKANTGNRKKVRFMATLRKQSPLAKTEK